ncbi:hypothetical protein GCM10009430_28060 [Aquimarina litoralis]|uniref:PH domain-containing protein n=1 Tax=Aquimarina litoralis TaxID=584605 RepID=A0ABP3U7T4_9FLAO
MFGKKVKHNISANSGINSSKFKSFDLNFIELDHTKMILDFSQDMKYNPLVSGIIICSIAIFLLFFSFQENILWTIFFSFVVCIGLLVIIRSFSASEYHIELDRQNNTISFPLTLLRIKKKVCFRNIKIKRLRLMDTEGNPDPDFCYLSITNYGFFFRTKIYKDLEYPSQENLLLSIWSFYVWYMDKNRPLPPVDVFDQFRQQDYERRKASGFPKPLYPSDIKTPETTKEQQKERETIGGW